KLSSRRRNDPCDRKRKQNPGRAGRAQELRRARGLFIERTAKAGESAHRQRDLSFRARHETNDRADLADRERKSASRGIREKYLSTLAATQLRDAPFEQWRRSA